MSALQGRAGELWAQTGASTAFTAEACTLVSGTTYKITNAAKRQWDPATAVLVYVGAVLQTSGYSLQMPIGRIVFDSAPGGAVTVTGAYFATAKVGLVTNWELNITSQIFEITALGDTARTYVGDNLPEWSGSFERFYEDDTWEAFAHDNDTTGYRMFVKLYEDVANDRVWIGNATVTSWGQSVPMEMVTESVSFQGEGAIHYIDDET